MTNWYTALKGEQQGPFTLEKILQDYQSGILVSDSLVWRNGFAEWQKLSQVPELTTQRGHTPPLPGNNFHAHEIEYEVFGNEMQYVEILLDPGESAVAEAGTMMFMSDSMQMETIFGDGSPGEQNNNFLDKMIGAGKRLITGENLFMTVFSFTGIGKGSVSFAAPYPGKIIPLDLKKYRNKLICQKDAFLCAAKGVAIGVEFQKKLGTALFGGEGFIMQKLEGDGLIFVHAGGTILEKELQAGETLKVDTGCLVAMTQTVDYDIEFVGGVKSAFFGGEGFFFAKLTGPGHVWLQSLPFSRLAGRIHKSAPQNNAGFSTTGEGSILGELGTMFKK